MTKLTKTGLLKIENGKITLDGEDLELWITELMPPHHVAMWPEKTTFYYPDTTISLERKT